MQQTAIIIEDGRGVVCPSVWHTLLSKTSTGPTQHFSVLF